METALHDLSRGMPNALTIWLMLVAVTTIGCALMAVPALRHQRHRAKARADAVRLDRVRFGAEALELLRYADEVSVAATRSMVTAQRRQAEWEAVCKAREAAWRSFAMADAAARRDGEAAVFLLPPKALTAEELTARQRHLDRVATEAYRRGDLSVADLSDILAHRKGWDPHRHPADHEVALHRLARQRRWAAYRAVAEIEQAARHGAEVAAAAERSLQDESYAARMRANRAKGALAPSRHPGRTHPAVVGRDPILATG